MRFPCEARGNGSLTGSNGELEKWIFTIGQKTYRCVKFSFQAVVNRNNNHGTIALHPGSADAPQSSDNDQHHRIPPIKFRKTSILSDSILSPTVADGRRSRASPESARRNYLLGRENSADDIAKLNAILLMSQVLLEIGCGNAEAALQIALKNPGIGVIATDLYGGSHQQPNGSGYGRVAQVWRKRQLPAQIDAPANLVILKAETDLLLCMPDRAIDTILLINPEPRAGETILGLLKGDFLSLRIKQGPLQIVILPYSRELGLMACGGCSFEHDPDWSRGLGFIMGSGLRFRRGAAIQWGVDLSRISAYTGNSTQQEIYICGESPI